MQEKIEKIVQKIDWILLFNELTSQEKEEFIVLKSGLLGAGDTLEFVTGEIHVDLTFPETHVSKKVLDFLHEYGLNIDGSGFDGYAYIWFEEDDDNCNDYDEDDDWSYDYWNYWHRDDGEYYSDDYDEDDDYVDYFDNDDGDEDIDDDDDSVD